MVQDSDLEDVQRLPSAYQLEIMISTLNDNLLALWSFATYLFSKGRRVAVIPSLWKAALLLGTVAVLALLIAMTDAWLNFVGYPACQPPGQANVKQSVSTVQLTLMETLQPGDPKLSEFSPGRGLLSDILNPLETRDESIPKSGTCDAQSDNRFCRQAKIAREYAELMTNSSETNKVLSRSEGSMILPIDHTTIADFQATTFGSRMSCRVVTDLCDVIILANTSYDCTVQRAGLNFDGSLIQALTDDLDSTTSGFRLCYYNDSSMSTLSNTNELISSPQSDGPTIWFAVALQVESGLLPIDEDIKAIESWHESSIKQGLGIPSKVHSTFGFVPIFGSGATNSFMQFGGVLSCTTTASDVSYTLANDTITHDTWTIVNATAASLFVRAFRLASMRVSGQLQQGMRTAVAKADEVEDVASGFAKAYDQTILSLVAGMLVNRPPSKATRATTLQVTRIPYAPFITLIILDIAYAALGTGLMIAALIALRKAFGSFENPAWGDDAKNVGMLFAERRGESPPEELR
ncbi:MAG: hypothetical protein Q9207_003433 [Kuettlingeria erythrocarpa]